MIHIDNLNFSYNQKQKLFDELSLSMPPGNIYGLLGKNGAGKTTLLKVLSGLLFPQKGNMTVLGYEPLKRNPAFLSEIYFIPEEFSLPPMEMSAYVRLFSPFYPRFSYKLFNEFVYEFQLPSELKFTAMSYGQKKKFILSFGLATDCSLLLLDEPTNGLDIPSKSQFRKIVANAMDDHRSFIISTHQVRDMENLIDPIIILDEGKIIFNRYLDEISEKLVISRETEEPEGGNILYSEPSLGGYLVVRKNDKGKESRMNLEILFNVILENKDKINQIFN